MLERDAQAVIAACRGISRARQDIANVIHQVEINGVLLNVTYGIAEVPLHLRQLFWQVC